MPCVVRHLAGNGFSGDSNLLKLIWSRLDGFPLQLRVTISTSSLRDVASREQPIPNFDSFRVPLDRLIMSMLITIVLSRSAMDTFSLLILKVDISISEVTRLEVLPSCEGKSSAFHRVGTHLVNDQTAMRPDTR